MVKMLVDLLGITVLPEQTAENTHTPHPDNLERKSGVGSTASLTDASVTALALGLISSGEASARVDYRRLADDKTILDQLADVLARVCQSDLVDLIRVQPDLSLTALEYGSCKTLLKPQRHHGSL